MHIYTVDNIEKAMISALSIYHPNDKSQALKLFNNMKKDILRMPYQEAKRRSSQATTRLYECLWLLNEYKKNSYLHEDHIKIPLSKRIDTFYIIDRRLQSMPEILKEALDQQTKNNLIQKEKFARQKSLQEKHASALRQKHVYNKNISYLKKIPSSPSPKRRPKF
ncbi:MAG: hypothetical protein KUG81_07690 [Gammaproteobacteria bacterium]|nr:hypothetical protein [Gammaproteobacteria bacterium]